MGHQATGDEQPGRDAQEPQSPDGPGEDVVLGDEDHQLGRAGRPLASGPVCCLVKVGQVIELLEQRPVGAVQAAADQSGVPAAGGHDVQVTGRGGARRRAHDPCSRVDGPRGDLHEFQSRPHFGVGGPVAGRAVRQAVGDGIGVGELKHARPGGKSGRQLGRVRQGDRLGQHAVRDAEGSRRRERSLVFAAAGAGWPRPVLASHYAAWS
ncbi:MAG TPA: hypothetical protein VGS06_44440 [Streptosporangiaceae bacterium]|nr:hypothetical protein [Streptosporangiaceae bacterium]